MARLSGETGGGGLRDTTRSLPWHWGALGTRTGSCGLQKTALSAGSDPGGPPSLVGAALQTLGDIRVPPWCSGSPTGASVPQAAGGSHERPVPEQRLLAALPAGAADPRGAALHHHGQHPQGESPGGDSLSSAGGWGSGSCPPVLPALGWAPAGLWAAPGLWF